MKTALEIPDTVLRGIPLREFVTEAGKDKLAANAKAQEKPWVKHMSKLKHLRKETEPISQLIEEDSERIGPEHEPTGWSAH